MEDLHPKIQEMCNADINVGNLVEIILKEGAEWYNGWSQAPTVDPQGYQPPGDKSLLEMPGIRTVGYVGEYQRNKVTLAPSWGLRQWGAHEPTVGPIYESGSCFVHADVIHSYKRL